MLTKLCQNIGLLFDYCHVPVWSLDDMTEIPQNSENPLSQSHFSSNKQTINIHLSLLTSQGYYLSYYFVNRWRRIALLSMPMFIYCIPSLTRVKLLDASGRLSIISCYFWGVVVWLLKFRIFLSCAIAPNYARSCENRSEVQLPGTQFYRIVFQLNLRPHPNSGKWCGRWA